MSNLAEDNVVVRNIYYMMAYAFRTLDVDDFAHLKTEPFENLADLLAAILTIGISAQRRRGFEHDYSPRAEEMLGVRGRIDMRGTARIRAGRRNEVACEFDEFTEDTYKNRILKTCAGLLVRDAEVPEARRRELKRALVSMRDVAGVDPTRVEWARLRYHRNNGSYRLLMNVCYMVVQSLILSTDEGETSLATFSSGQRLHALYESFVLEYFRKEHPELAASAKVIDRKASGDAPAFLPQLCTDITLERGGKMLIIDAKCYGRILGTHHDKEILSPANLNQIQSYVMHAAYGTDLEVQGMLLYALTESEDARDESWDEIGHTWHCRTLDLGREFSGIAAQLDEIALLVA